MGLFYSFINDLISNSEINAHVQKPCGQSGCCSSHPHLKQQISDARSTPCNNNSELSMNNTNHSRTSSLKRNRHRLASKNSRQLRSKKAKTSSSPHYSLLSNDEERLLEYVLDAYITYKGSEDLMAKSLSQQLNTDITKMEVLCRTLCQLIEAKIQ